MTRSRRPVARLAALGFLSLLSVSAVAAGVLLEPVDAPDWQISEWINGDPGPLSRLRGRVVVINFFQLWCPGSNEFSVPLFKEWQERFAGRDDVMLVSIETVFEGHDVQTPERLRAYVRESGLTHPVGIDAYAPDDPVIPVTMKRFGTEGTPQVVIVDKRGKIRFSHFGRFDPMVVEAFIERLARESDRGDGSSPSSRRPGHRRR